MVINPYLRVGPIPLHHKYCHNSKNAVIRGVSAPFYEVSWVARTEMGRMEPISVLGTHENFETNCIRLKDYSL